MLKAALAAGAAVATAGALLALVIDPTAGAGKRLDTVEEALARKERLATARPAKLDVAQMARSRLFIMTTGPDAYKEKAFQVLGVSISPRRKAALIATDGAAPVWISVGEVIGDAHLIDVGTNGVRFETPIGIKTVSVSEGSAAPTSANPAP